MLSSLLADPASIHIKLTMGGPPTSDVCLQQKAPFCFSRHDSINNSQPHLGSIPLYLCNHTSHLSFGSRYCFGSIAFSGRFPSASEDTSLVWGSANKAIAPDISVAPNNHTLPIPLIHNPPKWAIQFIPLLISLEIAAGIGTGTAGLMTSLNYSLWCWRRLLRVPWTAKRSN